MYNFLRFLEPLALLVADRQQQVDVFLWLGLHHLLQNGDGELVLAIEDVADAQKVLQIEVIILCL